MWADNTVLTYDQSEPIEYTRLICHYLTPFRKSLLQIYNDLVQNGVSASIHEDDRGLDPVGVEIWKPCAYHNATNHSLSSSKRHRQQEMVTTTNLDKF